ncbi:hypothetical protein FRC17_010880 [Serendipita sp. 399]|nr:hypothetical protein FRC17_010880 [Serendipita sp. 399]
MEPPESSLNDVPRSSAHATSAPFNWTGIVSKVLQPPYQIVYASLLLAFSVPVTFAGAFLTLDRTRQFAPSATATMYKEKSSKWRLEGGIGGLLGGWLFGALFIMNRTNSSPLGGIQFLVVWLLSAVVVALLSARWKYVAIIIIGSGGGAAFSLWVDVACHPAQLARVILLGVCTTLSPILCLLPIPKVQHGALRSAASWMGALGLVISISILGKLSTWSDVWARLWVSWDRAWGTGPEKGLTAAFIILAMAGMGVDWLLKRQFGENPDEKWDRYLANYSSQLPNAHDRPGNFRPSVPFWKRAFNSSPPDPVKFHQEDEGFSRSPLSPLDGPGRLRTKGHKSRPYSGNSFQPLRKDSKNDHPSDSDASSSDDEQRYIPRPWAKRKDTQASLSGATLADGASATSKGKRAKEEKDLEQGIELVYSDGESASTSRPKDHARDAPGWTPEFIKRSSIGGRKEIGTGTELDMKRSSPSSSPPPGAVPMTPSLIKALDRVSQAQNEAYGGIASSRHTPYASHSAGVSTPGRGVPSLQAPTPGGGYDWGVFWKTVENKTKEENSEGPSKAPKQ